jgi:phosphate transport system protein
VYCAEKIERMGDLAAHIADTARFTDPRFPRSSRMPSPSWVRSRRVWPTGSRGRSRGRVRRVGRDGSSRRRVACSGAGVDHWRGLAARGALGYQRGAGARFYERFADQAVSVTKRLEFAETGQLPTSGA